MTSRGYRGTSSPAQPYNLHTLTPPPHHHFAISPSCLAFRSAYEKITQVQVRIQNSKISPPFPREDSRKQSKTVENNLGSLETDSLSDPIGSMGCESETSVLYDIRGTHSTKILGRYIRCIPSGLLWKPETKKPLLEHLDIEPVIFTRSKAILNILKISCSHYRCLGHLWAFFVSFNIVLPIPLVLFFSTNSQCMIWIWTIWVLWILLLSIAFAIVCLGFYDTGHSP